MRLTEKALALVAAACLLFVGCQNQYVIGGGGVTSPGGGGVVGPDPVGCGAITSVKVVALGVSPGCTLGTGFAIAVGCVMEVTATPMIGNTPADATIHGPNVLWEATGGVSLQSRSSSSFNRGVEGLVPVGSL